MTETVAIGGIPVHLVDTAGIRKALDEAEMIGVRKSMEALADADMVLVVVDTSAPLGTEDAELMAEVEQRTAIIVENKADLVADREELVTAAAKNGIPRVRTSATTGEGIGELRGQILRHVSGEQGPPPESGFLTNVRQERLVRDALAALEAARRAVETEVPHEMLLLDLYNALRPLDEITGATTTDDILNLIFSRFCIGK